MGKAFYTVAADYNFKNYTQDPTGLPNEALENSDAILEFISVGDG